MRHKVGLLLLLVTPFFVLGPASITTAKIIYGVSVLFFALYIFSNVNWAFTSYRGVITSAISLMGLVVIGILVGTTRNNSFESLSSAYNLLIPALWLITIPYASSKVSSKFLLKVFFLLGFIASFITFYKWTLLRGYSNFSFDLKALDSDWNIYLILIVFLLLWNTFGKKERILYFVILLSSMLLSVLSGTRTLFFIYGYIFILILFFVKKQIFPIVTLSISFIAVFYLSIPTFPEALQRRYLEFFTRFESIGVLQYFSGFDESTRLRFQQRVYFKEIWLENAIFGTGIGQSTVESIVVADTPFAFLAQFGLIGAAGLVLVLLYLYSSTFQIVKQSNLLNAKILTMHFFCLFPVTIAYNWTLHKSFWLSLSCLIGYVLNTENDSKRLVATNFKGGEQDGSR